MLLTPDGKTLIVWEPGVAMVKGPLQATKIKVYERDNGKELFTFSDVGRQANAVSISADGKTVAIAAADGILRLYDLEKKGQMFPGGDWFLFDAKEGAGDIALTPDGSHLVAANSKGDVKVCKVAGRETMHEIKAHTGGVICVQASADGKRFATFGQDNILKLWDLASGKELRRWNMQGNSPGASGGLVINLAFTPDGRQLVTANANTTLFVLDLP